MGAFTITSLSDTELQKILVNCPIKWQSEIRRVCKRWNLIATRTLRDQKTLKLLVVTKRGGQNEDQNTEEILGAYYPTEAARDQLIRTSDGVHGLDMFNLKKYFHRVSHLYIHWVYAGDLSKLISQWSLYLTALTLTSFPQQDEMLPTWKAIGEMPFLQSLHLVSLPNSLELPVGLLANVLGQLESFKLFGYKKSLVPILGKLGSSLKHLHLDFVQCTQYEVYQVIANMHFGQNVSHFTLGQIIPPADCTTEEMTKYDYMEILGAFATKMSHKLTNLDILCASEIKLPDLMLKLVVLQRLTSMRLCFRDQFADFSSGLSAPLKMRSIRKLCLQFNEGSFNDFSAVIPDLFPNVKRVEIQTGDETFRSDATLGVSQHNLSIV